MAGSGRNLELRFMFSDNLYVCSSLYLSKAEVDTLSTQDGWAWISWWFMSLQHFSHLPRSSPTRGAVRKGQGRMAAWGKACQAPVLQSPASCCTQTHHPPPRASPLPWRNLALVSQITSVQAMNLAGPFSGRWKLPNTWSSLTHEVAEVL